MRLSCNFVNVYTIAYRVQYSFTRVHARILNGHPREDPRAEVGEAVRVGVGVRIGAVECQFYLQLARVCRSIRLAFHLSAAFRSPLTIELL